MVGTPVWGLRPSLLPKTGFYPKLAESVIVNRHLLDVSIKMSWPHCFMLVWELLSQSDILVYIYLTAVNIFLMDLTDACSLWQWLAGEDSRIQVHLKSHFHLCFFRQAQQSFTGRGCFSATFQKICCNSFIVAGCSLYVLVNVREC